MTDRVYPTAKPNPPPPAAATTTTNGGPPPKTSQLYNPNRPRPMYRPPQNHRPHHRTCSCRKFCCLCFIYTLIIILSLILLLAIAACIFYVLYHPKHPTFAISSLKITHFNLTASSNNPDFSHLNSHLDFTLTAKNPNKKRILFLYEPFSVYLSAAGVAAGNSTLPGFTHVQGNTTVIRGSVVSDPNQNFDSDTISGLKSDLGKKSGFPVTVQVETKVKVQLGKLKSKRVGIRVNCDGIRGFQPKNATSKTPTSGTTSGAKCKVDLRIKIWKFTF